jgi:hypothetical protein
MVAGSWGPQVRREALQRRYGFLCRCERCEAEAALGGGAGEGEVGSEAGSPAGGALQGRLLAAWRFVEAAAAPAAVALMRCAAAEVTDSGGGGVESAGTAPGAAGGAAARRGPTGEAAGGEGWGDSGEWPEPCFAPLVRAACEGGSARSRLRLLAEGLEALAGELEADARAALAASGSGMGGAAADHEGGNECALRWLLFGGVSGVLDLCATCLEVEAQLGALGRGEEGREAAEGGALRARRRLVELAAAAVPGSAFHVGAAAELWLAAVGGGEGGEREEEADARSAVRAALERRYGAVGEKEVELLARAWLEEGA